MKKTICLAALLASTSFAHAQTRPSTTTMTCAAAAGLVQQRGAVVLGMGGDAFDRFVRDASFCSKGQQMRAGFSPTTDNRACLVGWRCYDESREDR